MAKVIGIVLLTTGVLAVVYGGVSYTPQSPEVNVGPLEITVAMGFVGGGLLVRRKA